MASFDYNNVAASGHARVHAGNVYNYNYGYPEPAAVHPEDPVDYANPGRAHRVSPRLKRIQEWLGGIRGQSRSHETVGISRGRDNHLPQWLLRNETFANWIATPNSWMWLYGIPGCGKTVLNAKVVRHFREKLVGDNQAVVHFYFDFRSLRNDVDLLLRSLILQLSDHKDIVSGHGIVRQLFDAVYSVGAKQLSSDELMEALRRPLGALHATLCSVRARQLSYDELMEALRGPLEALYDTLHSRTGQPNSTELMEALRGPLKALHDTLCSVGTGQPSFDEPTEPLLGPLGELHDIVCRGGARQPSSDELMETLRGSLAMFDKVFIILDALDEYPGAGDRERELRHALELIFGWNLACIHVLVTSRRDGYVSYVLEDIVPQIFRMEFARLEVDEEIGAWVDDELERGYLGRKIGRWHESDLLKSEIRTKLMSRASGMFLLTKLQIEELERCHNERDVDLALGEMPSDLGELYDRALAKISDRRQQRYAQEILTWLAFARRPLCVNEVEWAPAFAKNDQSELVLDPRMRIQDGANEIFNICWSLVRVDSELESTYGNLARVELAHSTVREHLIMDRSTTLWLRPLDPMASHYSMAQAFLAYLLHLSQLDRRSEGYQRQPRNFSLAWYAIQAWPEHAALCDAVSRRQTPSDPLHRQMQHLLSDNVAMEALITCFEDPVHHEGRIQKLLQDLRIVWYHTSMLRLGTVVETSLPPTTPLHHQTYRWAVILSEDTIREKLGVTTDSDDNVLREIFSKSGFFESQHFLELDLKPAPKGQEAEIPAMTMLWSDDSYDVAVVRISDPAWSESLLPVVVCPSFTRTQRQNTLLNL